MFSATCIGQVFNFLPQLHVSCNSCTLVFYGSSIFYFSLWSSLSVGSTIPPPPIPPHPTPPTCHFFFKRLPYFRSFSLSLVFTFYPIHYGLSNQSQNNMRLSRTLQELYMKLCNVKSAADVGNISSAFTGDRLEFIYYKVGVLSDNRCMYGLEGHLLRSFFSSFDNYSVVCRIFSVV